MVNYYQEETENMNKYIITYKSTNPPPLQTVKTIVMANNKREAKSKISKLSYVLKVLNIELSN